MQALSLLFIAACTPAPNDFLLVHHRGNGCDPNSTECSLAGARCIVAACLAGGAPCALEGDARIIRVRGGSLGDDLEIIWLHDGSTARTADCGADDIEVPGDEPIEPERLAQCRLVRPDGSPSEEPIPTLDDVIATLEGSPVRLFLELKTVDDAALDARLIEGAVAKLGGLRNRIIFASFDSDALTRAHEIADDVPTACFTPSGGSATQVLKVIAGDILNDVDDCLEAGHDYVFVPPNFIDASIIAHVTSRGARLGTYGADTATAFDSVVSWGHRLDVVYADHPSMFRAIE